MEEGYKHFSHPHNLIKHQLPDGVEVLCSGCNSSSTRTVYACWQCNFFLHEQCCLATRSMKHPSHPSHPLTLVPYPTYLSNSFYCNSCKIIGTGFSYSCADCEFDLHVQCACIPLATSFQKTHQFQELVPSGWNVQHTNMAHNVPFASVQHDNLPIAFMPSSSISSEVYPSRCQDLAYFLALPSGTTSPDPSVNHNQDSVSIPTGSQNPMAIVQDPLMSQNGPSFSNTTSSQTRPSASSPNIPPDPILSTQKYSLILQNGHSVSVPACSLDQVSGAQEPSMSQTGLQDKRITHFSHRHNLSIVNIQEGEEDEVTCSGCKDTLVGKGYSCAEPKCDFNLHESCFNLKREIKHKSHPQHPLTLLPVAPYNIQNGTYICNACFSQGAGFTYNCSICQFDLHVQCVSLPETVKRSDHDHMLKLLYTCPVKEEDIVFSCDVCYGEVQKDRWEYYCESCNYCTHLGCVDREACENHSINTIDAQTKLQMLQIQTQMARLQVQGFLANMENAGTGIRY